MLRPLGRSPLEMITFAVDIDDWGQVLAGQLKHFVSRRLVRHDVECLMLDTAFSEPIGRFVTPATIRFYEQSNFIRLQDLLLLPKVSRKNFSGFWTHRSIACRRLLFMRKVVEVLSSLRVIETIFASIPCRSCARSGSHLR